MDVFTNLNLSKPHRLGIIMEILGFPGGSSVKNLPAVQETQAQSLVWDDPLEEGTATHSSILAGESHGQRSLAGYSPWGHKESDMTEMTEHTCVETSSCGYDPS